MLHILLLILKIVGILLLAVLCLLILAAAVLILNPVSYRLEGTAEEWADTIRARLRFHWLFHLIRGEAVFEKGELKWKLRIAWKKFGSGAASEEDAHVRDKQIPEKADDAPTHRAEEDARSTDDADPGGEPGSSDTERCCEQKAFSGKTDAETAAEPEYRQESTAEAEKEARSAGPEQAGVPEKEGGKSGDPRPDADGSTKKSRREKNASHAKKEKTLYQKICDKIERVKDTFPRFCDKMKALMRKKERLSAFITNETHKSAFHKVLAEFRRFLGYLHPKRLEAEIEFGFEDPALTGYTLAWISLIYPMFGEYVEIQPDFHHRILKGNLLAEGKIRILYVLIPAWNLIWDKNVRTTFRHIRKLKL